MSSFKQNQNLGPATAFALSSYFPHEEDAFAFTLVPCDLWSALDRWDSSLAVPPPEITALRASHEACLFQAVGFKFTEFQHGQKNLHSTF